MANHHFANVGDVVKHLILAEVLASERPSGYAETHAGSLDYPLAGRDPGPGGVWDFMGAAQPELCGSAYAQVLSRVVGTPDDPGRYPGSMGIALRVLGPGARFVGCDLDPASCGSLRRGLRDAGAADAHVLQRDGLAMLAGGGRRDDLVLIDPFSVTSPSPEAGITPYRAFAEVAAAGGPCLLWYPVPDAGERLTWLEELIRHAPSPVRRMELRWADDGIGMAGCGMLAGGVSAESIARVEALTAAFATALQPRLRDLRAA